ncbi:MAG: right-handed parallel beta-helix repeat-containing protein [Verrucomicrobiaceae bacterium]|nr:MAG: right-handed parallel beta-helix repeat-containing protein [Verrucomicrobiaceae bacterium]
MTSPAPRPAKAIALCGVLVAAPFHAHAQPRLSVGTPAGGLVPLTLTTQPGRMYRWESSAALDVWAPLPLATTAAVPLLATGTTMSLSAPVLTDKGFYRVKETYPFFPAWADVPPLRTLQHTFNPSNSATVNGTALRNAINALIPGDRLEIGPGNYQLTGFYNISLQGTAQAPIRIVAGPAGNVTISRADANNNNVELGINGTPVRHFSLEGITFSGGSFGIRLGDCSQVWIDRCKIQSTDSTAIAATASNTSGIHITRNEISNTTDGPGISVGSNNGSIVNTQSVYALNHVHDIHSSVNGIGIRIQSQSSGNLISGNHVHDTELTGIFIANATNNPVNVVENNTCHATGDYGIQALADCVVRNNLVMTTGAGGFLSNPISSTMPTRLTVVHNTFISNQVAARLQSWNTGAGMVFANNACYSQTNNAITIAGTGAGSTTFAGLVTFGPVTPGVPSTTSSGGLADFVNASWDGTSLDATPSAASPLRSAANATHLTEYDLSYFLRTLPASTGSSR